MTEVSFFLQKVESVLQPFWVMIILSVKLEDHFMLTDFNPV
jgi:hypothetical protein